MVRKFGKKKTSRGLRFIFDLSDVVYKEEHEPTLDLSRWFNFEGVNDYNYDFEVNWGDYKSKTRVITHKNDQGENSGYDVWELKDNEWIQTQFAAETLNLSHTYTRKDNISLVRVGDVGEILVWEGDDLRKPVDGELELYENDIERMFLDYDEFHPIEKIEGVFNVTIDGYDAVDDEGNVEYHECLCPRLDGYDAPVHDSITDSLTTALVPYCAQSPLVEARGLFNNCWRFRRIDGSLFKFCTETTDLSRLFRNTRIDFVPEYIFSHCVALEDVSEMFEGSLVKSLPPLLFSECPKLKIIDRILHRCAAIKEVPEDLFAHNPSLLSARAAFKFMPQCLNIPYGLLRENYHTELYDVYEIFCGGIDEIDPTWCFAEDGITVKTFEVGSEQAVTSFMPELWTWDRFKDLGFLDTCYNYWGCDRAINTIPETWKLSMEKPEGYLYEDYETVFYINNFVLPEGCEFKEYVTLNGGNIYEHFVDEGGNATKSINSRYNVSLNDEYAIDVDVTDQSGYSFISGAGALYNSTSIGAAYIALINKSRFGMKSGRGNEIQAGNILKGHNVWNISKAGISIGQGQNKVVWTNTPIVSNTSKWHFASLEDTNGNVNCYALNAKFYGGYLKRNGTYNIRLYPCIDSNENECLYESVSDKLYRIRVVGDYTLMSIMFQLMNDSRFKSEGTINDLLGGTYKYVPKLRLQNNGHIDTGRIVNANDEYYFEFKALSNGGSGGNGSSSGDSVNSFTYMVVSDYKSGTCRCRIGSEGDVNGIQYNNSATHYENTLFKIKNNASYPVSFYNRSMRNGQYEIMNPSGLSGRSFQTSTGGRHWRFAAISNNGGYGDFLNCYFYGGMIRGSGFNKVYIPTIRVSDNKPTIIVYNLNTNTKTAYSGLTSDQLSLP